MPPSGTGAWYVLNCGPQKLGSLKFRKRGWQKRTPGMRMDLHTFVAKYLMSYNICFYEPYKSLNAVCSLVHRFIKCWIGVVQILRLEGVFVWALLPPTKPPRFTERGRCECLRPNMLGNKQSDEQNLKQVTPLDWGKHKNGVSLISASTVCQRIWLDLIRSMSESNRMKHTYTVLVKQSLISTYRKYRNKIETWNKNGVLFIFAFILSFPRHFRLHWRPDDNYMCSTFWYAWTSGSLGVRTTFSRSQNGAIFFCSSQNHLYLVLDIATSQTE